MPSEQRLHPASILFSFGKSLKALALPGLLVLVFGRSTGPPVPFWPSGPELSGAEFWVMLLLIPAGFAAVVRYLTFSLRYEGDELVIRQGILFRSERHVPYARIQNLDAVRNVLHQLLGVVEVRVDTGAGNEPEATISVIPVAAFEEMRQRVFSGRAQAATSADGGRSAAHAAHTLLTLPVSELLLLGFIDNRGFVLIGALLGALWQVDLLDSLGTLILNRMGWSDPRAALQAGAQVTGSQAAAVLVAAGVVIMAARLISMAWAVLRFHGFQLRRVGDDLRTEFGLFTRVAATIPIYRVQTLTIWQGPLQRLAGREALSVQTAGGQQKESAGRSERPWLAPIVRTAAVPDLVQHVMPELACDALEWQAVHPRAFRRVFVRAAAFVSVVSALGALWLGAWTIGAWLAGLGLAGLAARRHVRHLRWAATDDVVAFRSGWLWKRLTVARTTKVQTVTLVESPFDRRSAMAAVHVDTAGAGAQSHRVRIPYLDGRVAADLHRVLAVRAASSAFRW